MKEISGGITAPIGFTAGGIHCGVKQGLADGNQPIVASMEDYLSGKKDLALILSERACTTSATYTTNRVKAAPLYTTMEHLKGGTARGIIANSGNANACAPLGAENALRMCAAAAQATGLKPSDFAVASTGVIGQTINIAAIEAGVPVLAGLLKREGGSDAAAQAIMTTDTSKKEIAVSFELDGKAVILGGIAKGSGMIHPNMGTMLCFLTCDANISQEILNAALRSVVVRTFNRVTVDGDTSTNDMCLLLCNGMAGNAPIVEAGEDYEIFCAALHHVCETLAKAIAADGEGATRLVTCTVSGAVSEEIAERLAKSVVGSPLVKAAMFGADANWGRVLCAMGYSGADFQPETVEVRFRSPKGEILVCRQGAGVSFDEETAREVLTTDDITIAISLGNGGYTVSCWGCDLTYDYVKINGDYRT